MSVDLILSDSPYPVCNYKKETLEHMPLRCNLTNLLRKHFSIMLDLNTVNGTNLIPNLTI
jgi:hypothetical protein